MKVAVEELSKVEIITREGKTFYSVEDAKRDQKAYADAYDKRIGKLQEKRDKAR